MKLLKSKTINFALLLAMFGAAEQNLPLVQDALGDKYGWVMMAVAAIVAVLRVVTTKPLSEK